MHSTRSHSIRPRSFGVFSLALSLAMLAACSTQTAAYASQPDANTTQTQAPSSAVPPVAYLQANTGGDSMLANNKRGYTLEMHVIDGAHTVKSVAQCTRISSGSALGGGTERELQVAICEGDTKNQGEYWLISEPGVVSVRRGPIDTAQKTLQEHRFQNPQARAIKKENQ